MTSKTISVAVAAVVTVMVGVVIAASLGTQDDVHEEADPQPTHTPSETLGTVNGTPATLVEPQDSASQTTEPPTWQAPSEEFETVDVGVMFPSASVSASHGHDNNAAVRLGAADFNAYLEEIGASWRMNLIFVDTQFNSTTDIEKIQSLDSKDVKFVLGPESSAEIRSIKSYVDSNGMVLISPSSTSPSLAIDDGIFRLAPNPVQQGKALALLFEREGIEAVIPIYHGDVWNIGIYNSIKNSFEALGGVMDDGISYSGSTYELTFHDHYYDKKRIFSLDRLSSLVKEYTHQYSADKVAVLVIGFSETAYLLDSASSFDKIHSSPRPELTFDLSPNYFDNLDSVRWFGSDSISRDSAFLDHPKASAFAQDVDFVSIRSAPSTNNVYEHVLDYFADFEDMAPGASAFASYDSVWVLGKAVLETGSADPPAVRDAITDAASTHTGAIGTVHLNEFGDFATPDYDLWRMSEGAWHKSGHFDADSGTFDSASGLVMDKDITKSNLPKVVDVGMMVREWGTLSYEEEEVMAIIGTDDFNNYLEEIGAPWRMNLVWANIGHHPVVDFEKIQLLDSKDIKLVLGPITSADIHHIKPYVDFNDMVIITSWSAATSLAIVDSIFRMVPDNTQQGNVLSLLFEQEGIEAVIPIYRGDDWGDSIYESARNSFEALGGVMDNGIRYSPEAEASAYYAKASMLSDLVDEYTDQYPTDKVAVLMIGFSETVHLLGSAGSFDNLDSVRWFGSDGSSNDGTLSYDPTTSAFLQDVNFVSILFGTSRNDVYADVQEYFEQESFDLFPAPNSYSFSTYDSIWVLGKTILETDSVDPLTVRDAITDVASRHTGTIGTINLNEFGDFATPNYDLWSIRDGQWYVSGYFDADSGTFSFT